MIRTCTGFAVCLLTLATAMQAAPFTAGPIPLLALFGLEQTG